MRKGGGILVGPVSPAVRAWLVAGSMALALGMAGLAWKTTAIGSLLFMNHGVPHPEAVAVERILGWCLVGLAVGLIIPRARLAAAFGVAAIALVLAWASRDQGGYPFSRFAFAAHAMRIAAPVALILALLPSERLHGVRGPVVYGTLVLASAVTFAVHGYEAIRAHPWFVDMTIQAFDRVFGWRLGQGATERFLDVVGVVDIAVALVVLVVRSRAALGWMAFWGLLTALLRVVVYGVGGMPEMVVRLPQALMPLVLLALLRPSVDTPAKIVPVSAGAGSGSLPEEASGT